MNTVDTSAATVPPCSSPCTPLRVPVPSVTTLPIADSAAVFTVGRVFCIGRNYPWDATAITRPAEPPGWFMKPASAVVLAQGDLPYPPETQDFCHEIELVVAIHQGGRNIAPAEVERQHIWGYAAGLDLTRRDLQQHAKRTGGSWEAAKAFDHSAPCTPLVPTHVCGHPRQANVWLDVNGQRRQHAKVSDLLWSIPELVTMLSRSVTLLPGDLIFTGTPAGVGPLQVGDVVSAGVDHIGQLSMTVVAPSFHIDSTESFS